MKSVFLFGFMGAGKTAAAKALSRLSSLEFRDSDLELKKKTGKNPARLIREKGLKNFRKLEKKTALSLSSRKNLAAAFGGGFFPDSTGAELRRKNGISVWLKTPLKISLKRTLKNPSARPLAEANSKKKAEKKLTKLYKIRKKHYEKADIIISPSGLTPAGTARLILKKAELE